MKMSVAKRVGYNSRGSAPGMTSLYHWKAVAPKLPFWTAKSHPRTRDTLEPTTNLREGLTLTCEKDLFSV